MILQYNIIEEDIKILKFLYRKLCSIKCYCLKFPLFSIAINNNMNFHNITIYSPELLFKHTTKEKKEIDIKKIKASLKL